MPCKMIMIFDLDGTVVCTAHRYRNKPGTNEIDLDYWFANSVPEMIAKDALLPLADVMRRYYDEGHTVVICTARQWSRGDAMTFDPGPVYEQFLADKGLRYHALLHRELVGADHATYSDGDLKTKLLNDWAAREGLATDWRRDAVMFDDNVGVIRKMFADKLICLDAIKYNARLAA